ncbi:hypothetical protein P175DRAFT_0356063 [Aspergillus ochraceoroseus IBT 24754]|nr:uncharacterized protein P175DRAFT_0356063 [Aspergillus ochraceoroseus IBT 24754]KKK24453.1 hypothetical protein AOCH_006206 [Aspergillus ochraceoroseus]PTU18239.1 hypothetical protein P175DRAFT_0356063 [Aspergillus ochraceoroseus IBT 24754]
MIWDHFDGKSVLITGASGFLGTALVHRIIDRTSASHLYLICRGGLPRLREQWRRILSSELADPMLDPRRVTVLDGDILKPDFGLPPREVERLQGVVEIVIHSASSINLGSRLSKIAAVIIGASEMVSEFALKCPKLDQFAYISTAYVNAFLYAETDALDTEVEEKVYALRNAQGRAADEWALVRSQGSSGAYEAHEFPWAYAYAKHLTERLLMERFEARSQQQQQQSRLLILRPSIIGPAKSFPFPAYCVPTSSPLTMMIAGSALDPSKGYKFHTRCPNPATQSTADEVPVDIVVDRLLAHLGARTPGPVHAVSGKRARWTFQDWWCAVNILNPSPRGPVLPEWTSSLHWRSPELHPVARLHAVIGTSFHFHDDKTERLWESLSVEDRLDLQLFAMLPSEYAAPVWVHERRAALAVGVNDAMRWNAKARL